MSNVKISGEYYEIGERIIRIGSVSEGYSKEECENNMRMLEGTKREKVKKRNNK
jgi:hypothetical protein